MVRVLVFGLRFQRDPFRFAFQNSFRIVARGCLDRWCRLFTLPRFSQNLTQTGDACTCSDALSLGAGAGESEWWGEGGLAAQGLGEGRPVTGSQGWGGGVVVRDLAHQTLLFIFNGFSSRRSLDTTSPFAKRHVAPARTCWVAGDGIRGESDEFLFHGRCVWGDCQGTTGCLWRVCLGLAALK